VVTSKLPKVNKELAHRLLASQSDLNNKTNKKQKSNLLEDQRFQDIFANPDFQIDEQSEEYRLLHPVVNKLDKPKPKPQYVDDFEQILDDEKVDDSDSDRESDSSDDNHVWTKEVKEQHRLLRIEKSKNKSSEIDSLGVSSKFYKLKEGKTFSTISDKNSKKSLKVSKASFEERLNNLESNSGESNRFDAGGGAHGNRIMTFELKDNKKLKNKEEMKKHLLERKKFARTAKGITFSKTKN
jgi:ribosome biogenesis protein ENP2